ncbi:MAG: response regulator receiver sensor signal transduction histidine kinase [Verrucomicrobia bacterium]|nr:response regulator receiver sensor signal transduction histidine kinase [Verrucomicrobiota bacterium]
MDSTTAASAPDLRERKILIVDDDRANVLILTSILKPEGYLLHTSRSGELALEDYPRIRPDLVLLDVVMPGINGFEACRILKKTYGDRCVPIIFITANSESASVLEGFNAGGVDYLQKPFHNKEVVARIRLHLQNQLLIEQQKALVEKLNKADAAKNRFLGMAAHDLRNPLVSIRGLAEFLRDGVVGPLNSDQLDLVNTMHSAGQAMLEMVNDLLDLAAIEAGELKLNPVPSSLAELIAKSARLMNIEAAKKRTRIVFDSASTLPPLRLDPNKMGQVIDNLLSNAAKYSPSGSTITVVLFADPARGMCGFAVQDQGPGIPQGERNRLFKDFGRLSAQPTGGEKSTGLGLAICHNIVTAHHGTITAENLPGGGSEFRVALPLPR